MFSEEQLSGEFIFLRRRNSSLKQFAAWEDHHSRLINLNGQAQLHCLSSFFVLFRGSSLVASKHEKTVIFENHENPSQRTLVQYSTRRAFINITPQVESCLREVASAKAWCWSTPCTSPLRCSSTTTKAGYITITKKNGLRTRAPRAARQYRHNLTGEDNADAHQKDRSWAAKW